MPRKPNEAGNARVKGFKADGTKDKRCARRGEEGYHERNTKTANEACRIYKTVDDLQAAIDAYFDHCEMTGELTGEEGLAYHLGVTVRTLHHWYDGERIPEFRETIEKAFDKSDYLNSIDPRMMEKAMVSRYIFQKKQKRHGGWQDKQEVRQDVRFELTIKDYDEELTK